jgi:hypothetical protein
MTLRTRCTGGLGGQLDHEPAVLTNGSAQPERELVTLASGANTLTWPTGSRRCVITPPTANTTAITYKGVAGDTGTRLHDTDWNVISRDASVASFVLNAAAQVVGVELAWY